MAGADDLFVEEPAGLPGLVAEASWEHVYHEQRQVPGFDPIGK